MVSLPDKTKVPAKFADNFMGTDQDVKDLEAPRPETRWCLLELPQKEIDALSKGSTFYFQSHAGGIGLDDGGAALCTESQTFSIEYLENSNSLFLAQVFEAASEGQPAAEESSEGKTPATEGDGEKISNFRCEVFGQVRGQMLTKPTPINTRRVLDLLSQQVLGADIKESELITVDILEYEVAASPAEIQAILKAGPYAEVNGSWRTIPPALEREILDTAVNIVAAKGWDHKDLDADALLKEMQTHLGEATVPTLSVLQKVMQALFPDPKPPAAAADAGSAEKKDDKADAEAKPKEGAAEPKPAPAEAAKEAGEAAAAGAEDDVLPEGRMRIDKGKADRFQALQQLRAPPQQVRDRYGLPAPPPQPKRPRRGATVRDSSGGAPLRFDEFAAILQEITGAAEKPDAEAVWKVLGNEAFLDEFESTLHVMDLAALPLDPRERLNKLFALQSHWNQGRLEGFIAPTLGAGVKVATWVLKNTRAVFVELVPGKEERFLIKKFQLG